MILRKPIITASGESVNELTFAWGELSFGDLKNAYRVKALITGGKGNDASATISPQLDSDLRIGVSWIAALKGDKRLELNDVLKLSLADTLALSDIAIDDYLLA